MPEDKYLSEELKEQLKKFDVPNIVVVGRTGSGKSTLINKVFGLNLASVGGGSSTTQDFDRYPPENSGILIPLVIYDSAGYEAARENEFVKGVINFLEEKQKEGVEKQIHLVWYVINASSARVEEFDKNVIDKIREKGIPAIIVLSQCDRARPEEISAIKSALTNFNFDENYDVIETASDPLMKKDGTPICEPYGLQELVDKTIERLPYIYTEAFIITQVVDLEKKRRVAWDAIYLSAAGCITGSALPIPGSTATTIIASQSALFLRIAYIYGQKEDAPFYLSVITPTTTLLATLLNGLIGDLATTIFPPLIPIVAGTAASYVVAFGLACTNIFEKMSKDNIYGQGKDEVKRYLEENFRAEFKKYEDLKINSSQELQNISIAFRNPPS
jgi:small GTP-binding protein